ncbi:MAG: hypothetical protein MI867_12615 [Pseudomonadales bacterium]|nr:hypothetical protein [Pseudomonadales bacterium]
MPAAKSDRTQNFFIKIGYQKIVDNFKKSKHTIKYEWVKDIDGFKIAFRVLQKNAYNNKVRWMYIIGTRNDSPHPYSKLPR